MQFFDLHAGNSYNIVSKKYFKKQLNSIVVMKMFVILVSGLPVILSFIFLFFILTNIFHLDSLLFHLVSLLRTS